MRIFTFLLVAGLLLTTFTLRAQEGMTGFYTFEDAEDLFKNYATEGMGNPMCEGVMKFLPDAPNVNEDDQPSIEGTDYEVISGINDNAIALKAHNWFKVWHGIPANGGGDYVNDFTIVIDVRIADTELIYSLFEANPTPKENGYTSEMEIVGGAVGSVGVPVSGEDELGFSTNILTADEWHRVVYAAALGTGIYIYVDGVLWHSVEGDFLDGYPAPYGVDTDPDDAAIKLCGNNEQYPVNDPARDNDKDVDLLAVFNRLLDASEIADLGGAGSWLGLGENVLSNDIKLYPNPANDVLTVSGVQGGTLEIVNMTGQVVESVLIKDQTTTFSVSHLHSGIYFVRVTDGRNSISQKVIIE